MYIELPEKRYFKIGEVAKAFGVNASLLRFWENEFDVLRPKKNAKGNRLFTQEDIKNLRLIYHLVKEKGFTLEGAKNKLKEKPEEITSNHDIIVRLDKIKNELLQIKNEL
jgi:DNA-binding transcriptional MerR regulator